MPAARDITGMRFGRLTAIAYTGRHAGKHRVWDFLCDCGKHASVELAKVTSGHTASCGCLRLDRVHAALTKDIRGQRFGRLTALQPDRSLSRRNMCWVCECSCGATVVVAGNALRDGRIRSCGCLQRECASERCKARALPSDERNRRRLASARKYGLRRRKEPLFRLRQRIARAQRRSLMTMGLRKSEPTFKTLGYSPSDLASHISRQFSEGMSWNNIGLWHVDHIVPVSTARSVEDLVRLNALTNLRPLWAHDNLVKSNKREFLI